MSYREKNGQVRWKKMGTRYYERNDVGYNAVIFGAPAPKQIWAWAVWSRGHTDEGIELSLQSARVKAQRAIQLVWATNRTGATTEAS